MLKSDFFFELPPELIAQTPIESREQSRLLCMDRISGILEHRRFYELPKLLQKGDCLILNDSRVMPARLLGRLETKQGDGSSACCEIVLLHEVRNNYQAEEDSAELCPLCRMSPRLVNQAEEPSPCLVKWECLTKPGKKTRVGAEIAFGDEELTATVKEVLDNGNRVIEFCCDGVFLEVLERLGKMPLPPYIHEELEDAQRYQTVYSKEVGSAAAPTAGLHFTKELLDEIKSKGVNVQYLTLHVGLGTFRPVKTEKIEDHEMHSEYYTISKATADAVNRTKEQGGRVIAVGTTSCRVLESCTDESGFVSASSDFTDIFIYPGYEFKCINGLITNFHLPESTLIMLVSALAGKKNTLHAYTVAIRERYRFFSFGDAMFIV